MRIYELNILESNYSPYYFPEDEEEKTFMHIADEYITEGKPAGALWQPMILLKKEQRIDPDFFDINGTGVLGVSGQAAGLLTDNLKDVDYELLPFLNDERPLFAFNLLKVWDVLEKDRFGYSGLPNGQIMDYEELYFSCDRLADVNIFKVPELPYSLFITSRFFSRYGRLGLEGLGISDDEVVFVD